MRERESTMYKHTLRKQAHVISTQKMCKLNNSKRREVKKERERERDEVRAKLK